MEVPTGIRSVKQFIKVHNALEKAMYAAQKAGNIEKFTELSEILYAFETKYKSYFNAMVVNHSKEFVKCADPDIADKVVKILGVTITKKRILITAGIVVAIAVTSYIAWRYYQYRKTLVKRQLVLVKNHATGRVGVMTA